MIFKVSKKASSLSGTSAQLPEGASLSLENLFYAMMLPSGNDAAYAISENVGALLSYEQRGQLKDLDLYGRNLSI